MNRKRILILFHWAILSLPMNHLLGQNLYENRFVHYTTAEGLSHNTITGIAQDSTGYVWVATSSGLNRYNGSRFTQYHSSSDSLSLPAEEINGLSWLDNHRLAVYASGVHVIDTRTGKTRNLFIPYRDKQFQYKFNMIEMVKGDKEGNIYVVSRSGFYHFDKDYNLVSRFDYYKDEHVPISHFFFGRDLIDLDDQRIMIVTIGGLFIYEKPKKQVRKMNAADCPLLAEFLDYPGVFHLNYRFLQLKSGAVFVLKLLTDSLAYVNIVENKKTIIRLPFNPLRFEFHYRTKIAQISDTLFYITSHNSGFFKLRFDPKTGEMKFNPEKQFAPYLLSAILKDRDDNLWIATSKGLLREDAGMSQVQMTRIPALVVDSFPNSRIDDIYATSTKIYAATRWFSGLLIYDKKTMQFEKQILFDKDKYDRRGNHITSIAAADSNTLLLGTDWPLIEYNHRTKKDRILLPPNWSRGDWVSDLYRDSKGNVWISAFNIYKYNAAAQSFTYIPTQQRLLNIPFAIEEDKEGHIWMAGHGLTRYNTLKDSFDLLIDSFPAIKMTDKQVNAMVIDHQNTVWFNSNNNGLIAYNIDQKTFRHFTRSDGLPDNNIASMIVIGQKLWIATYSGIACMDLRTLQIVSFGKEDGFPDMPVTKGARFFYEESAQQLYIGFANAIVRFNPYDIVRKKSPPHVFVETLTINGKKDDFLPGERITTSWRNNELMITIGSINFSDSYSQRFAYRILKDGRTTWQYLGNQPTFNVSNLSPGSYKIQVKSFSLNNRWPEQINEIIIVVSPPFWQETWFVVLAIVSFVVLGYFFIQWRTDVARKKEREKTNIERLKADDYKNQFELEQITNYFSSSLAGKKDEDEVLWDVANNLIARMNYVDCMIYLWNEDKTKMIQKAAYGPKGKPEFISASVFDVLPGQGIVGHVIQSRQPILIEDTRKDCRYRVDEEFRLSEVCVPIIHNGELMGIIDSEHYEPGYFKERDIKILTTIATLIGNKLTQIESEQSLEEKQVELANINEQLAEAQLAALQAQMNPHFVFNALNSIKRMILDADNEKASRYLSKFALMIRMTLNHSKDIFITLDENIQYLKAYLEMEQLRFDDSFTYHIYTEENIDAAETFIPSLMTQPLVENAIWHGLMQVEGEKKIKIGFTMDHNKITCIIEDNGIGIRQSEKMKVKNRPLHQSVGLGNLNKRIKIMNEKYDTDCSLVITDLNENGKNGRGTQVVLRFNVINP